MPPKHPLPRAASPGGEDRDEDGEVVMVRRSAVAPCVTCGLCGGILRDATAVSECLHSFCRKCIFKKFKDEDTTFCPTCSTDLGCHPLEKLRTDHNLLCIRLMLFPAKRRKVEEISLLHPASVSQPSHLPQLHGVGESGKKTNAFFMGESMNGEAQAEAAETLGMELTASPMKSSMCSRSAPAEEVGTFIVTLEKERRARASTVQMPVAAPVAVVAPRYPTRRSTSMVVAEGAVATLDAEGVPAAVEEAPAEAGGRTAPPATSGVAAPAVVGAGSSSAPTPTPVAPDGAGVAGTSVEAGEGDSDPRTEGETLTWVRRGEPVFLLDEQVEAEKWTQLINCFDIMADTSEKFKDAGEYLLELAAQKNAFLNGEALRRFPSVPSRRRLRERLEQERKEAAAREALLLQEAAAREEEFKREATAREDALRGDAARARVEDEVFGATVERLAESAQLAEAASAVAAELRVQVDQANAARDHLLQELNKRTAENEGLRKQWAADQETMVRLRTERAQARQVRDNAKEDLEKEKGVNKDLRDKLKRSTDALKCSEEELRKSAESAKAHEQEIQQLRQAHTAELDKAKQAVAAEPQLAPYATWCFGRAWRPRRRFADLGSFQKL